MKDISRNKEYQCTNPSCGYVSPKTHLVIFEKKEYRFCAKCFLKFLENNVPAAIELPSNVKRRAK